MKIAVIGAKGFVGSNLTKSLSLIHQVTPVTRNTLDLLNPLSVKEFLKNNRFDVIVNCAAIMTDSSMLNDARNNLGMFMNFYNNSNLFGKFINTASGAEFDRNQDINYAKEKLIFERMPTDSYGWGQNIKSRLCYDKKNFYNIRIFNCFGPGELSTRLIPRFLNNSEKIFEVINDRYFDYFSIQDLCTVVNYVTEIDCNLKDINAVYKNKFKISEVLSKFCYINNIEPNFVIKSVYENNYTGDGTLLESLPILLNGIDDGLDNYLKENANDCI
jgi:GDP-L-fucose synthase